MMGKTRAASVAREERLTWADLKAMIDAYPKAGRVSSVNAIFTLDRIAEIHLAVIAERNPTEVPKMWRTDPYSRSGKQKPTREFLNVTNILRDFG